MSKTVVLTLSDYYMPGYKAGGPITTLVNMVNRLGPDLEFQVVTRNRDLGETVPYAGIVPNTWKMFGGTAVCHLPPRRQGVSALCKILRSANYEVLYLNSFFSPLFSILPLVLNRIGYVPTRPVVLAPRGELCAGALGLKRWRKHFFLQVVKWLNLHGKVTWQASSEIEGKEIRQWFGADSSVVVAPDMSARPSGAELDSIETAKLPGSIKILFLSRIDAIKNLSTALTLLHDLRGQVEFNIVGPLEDEAYWRHCQEIIRTLPDNVTITYEGAVRPDEVPGVMKKHDLFFLPTLSENFGHVILEALSSGCPALISDRTFWTNLEFHGAGWDLPLDRHDLYKEVLQRCIDSDARTFANLRRTAVAFAQRFYEQEGDILRRNREVFQMARAGVTNRS